MKRKYAFSLVELSIVLVILGLLVGGVLSGQSLIRAAELRDVSTSIPRYSTAFYAFRDKYVAVPGDFNQATRFWTGCTNTARNTCNGDGDGIVEADTTCTADNSMEIQRMWQHLALGKLIEGNYDAAGLACDTSSTVYAKPGVNVPALRINNVGVTYVYNTNTANNFNIGQSLSFGTSYSNNLEGGFLNPQEAYGIDVKLDDGIAAQGKLNSVDGHSALGQTNCTDGSNVYVLTNSGQHCRIMYLVD